MASSSGSQELGSQQPYIPSLPNDIAMEVLARLPPRSHPLLACVCQSWRELVRSSAILLHRTKGNLTTPFLCLLQAAPQLNPKQHPLYCVTILNEHRGWERLPPIPEYHQWGLPLFARFASVGGKLVVVGGWNPATWETLRSIYIFSFTSWTWKRGANMPTTRSFFACAAVGNFIYVSGGHDNTKVALASAERYDLESDSWEVLPPMQEVRDECIGAALGSKLYAIGGYRTATQCKYMKSAEVFDPVTSAWSRIHNMIDVRPSVILSACGDLYAIHDRDVLVYSSENKKWKAIDLLHAEIAPPLCVCSFGRKLVVTGSRNGDEDSYRSFLYSLPRDSKSRGVWEALPVDPQFLGMARTSCVVES